jgi:hypothetical protein
MCDEGQSQCGRPLESPPNLPCGLEISKKEKLQIALDELLKTKGKKRCSG